MTLRDALDRPLRNLRLSVTDRCNLRCSYCMPEDEYEWLPHPEILQYEEISRLVDVFISLGVDRVRLTGGEPLLRRDLPQLVALLAEKEGIRDLALTTNGVLLSDVAPALEAAGLHRITVSLDTLRADRFFALTRRNDLERVLAGIRSVTRTALPPPKLDTVVMRGVNDDELVDLIEFARPLGAEIRFIEYMDVGGATRWSPNDVVSRAEMLRRLTETYGPIHEIAEESSAPADRFRLPDGLVFGIISSTTEPFCRSCDRSRLTADGTWFLCLYAREGVRLRPLLRSGASNEALAAAISASWRARTLRGAEARLALEARAAQPSGDRHFEMHTRGG